VCVCACVRVCDKACGLSVLEHFLQLLVCFDPPKMTITPKLVVCVFFMFCLGGGLGGGGGKVMLGC
jgi:hypothetical protein